jgi:hypothetical protein
MRDGREYFDGAALRWKRTLAAENTDPFRSAKQTFGIFDCRCITLLSNLAVSAAPSLHLRLSCFKFAPEFFDLLNQMSKQMDRDK